jgi:CheY-like chemotaxis protein
LTKCILIVEDDDAVRHTLSDALQDAGYAVATAMDGFDALDQIEQHPPDAVLLDLMMPTMDGWSFLECFRARSCAEGIPVGIISAAPMLRKTADAWGVQVAIGKPFCLNTLVSQVERLCEPLTL